MPGRPPWRHRLRGHGAHVAIAVAALLALLVAWVVGWLRLQEARGEPAGAFAPQPPGRSRVLR